MRAGRDRDGLRAGNNARLRWWIAVLISTMMTVAFLTSPAAGVGPCTPPDVVELTLGEVLTAMDEGHRFYTQGAENGKVAQVEKYTCSQCRRTYIRSTPDAVSDNNLDNLRPCRFSSS